MILSPGLIEQSLRRASRVMSVVIEERRCP
jgi:hypothetical protein